MISDLLPSQIAAFNVYSALAFLGLKILLKPLVRGLSKKGDGKSIILDSATGFGMDLSILGLSLVIGGLISGHIKLVGPSDAFCTLLIFSCVFFSSIGYGYYHRPGHVFVRVIAVTFSWVLGTIPFLMGTYFLLSSHN